MQRSLKRHIRRGALDGQTYCSIPAREGDVRLARFFRELEVLPRGSKRRAEFLAEICRTCARTHLILDR